MYNMTSKFSFTVVVLLIITLLIPTGANALDKNAIYEKVIEKLDVDENVFYALKDDCIYTYLSEEWRNDAQLAHVFGGMYYKKDKPVYLIKMTKDTKEESMKISDIYDSILISEKYETQGVKYSYKELFDIKEKLATKIFGDRIIFGERKGMDMPFTITGVGINDRENSVVVYMQSLNEAKIKWFKENISDSDMFIFETANEDITQMTTTLYPGQGLSRSTSQS